MFLLTSLTITKHTLKRPRKDQDTRHNIPVKTIIIEPLNCIVILTDGYLCFLLQVMCCQEPVVADIHQLTTQQS